jgi:hypothetical protein
MDVLLLLALHLLNKVKTVISFPPLMEKLYPTNYHVIYPTYRGGKNLVESRCLKEW